MSNSDSDRDISEENDKLCALETDMDSFDHDHNTSSEFQSEVQRDSFRLDSFRPNKEPTTLEIQRLPKLRPSLSTRLSTKFTKAGKAMHIFKDRKKKRVDESHKHFLTAHCIRDGIRYTTKNTKDSTEMANKVSTIPEDGFRVIKRTTLSITTAHQEMESESTSGASSFSTFSFLGGSNLDSKSFEFKEYAPQVFLKLRNHWGINQADYLQSLASDELYLDFQSNSKSGQFFFFSDDKFFMIKTLTPQECVWLQQCLEKYYKHNMKYEKTLLVKFMGLYRIKVPRRNNRRFCKTHFVVMRSTFDTVLPMHKKFDLKGSHVGREASESDKKKLFPVLKDLDLENSDIKLQLGPYKDKIREQLEVDCELLTSLNMMDYSLLVGIFDKTRVDPTYGIDDHTLREILAQDNCLHFTDRLDDHGLIYFMGVIDFLQHYNANKRFENIAKSVVNNSKEISSVKPNFYAARLVRFVSKFIDE